MRIVMKTASGLVESTASVQVTGTTAADARSIALAVIPASWEVASGGDGAVSIHGKRAAGGALDPISELTVYYSEAAASALPQLSSAGNVAVSRVAGI